MLNEIFFLVLFIISTESQTTQDGNCIISIKYKTGDFKEPQPLILSKNKNKMNFLYPNDIKGYINIRQFEKIYLACPGERNYITGIKGLINKSQEIKIKCVRQKIFKLDDTIVDEKYNGNDNNSILFNITSVVCKYLPVNEVRLTSERCFNNSTVIEVGFRLQNNFLRTIKVCRDNATHSTYYTHYKLTEKIIYLQTNYPRVRRWQSGSFFPQYNMDYLYKTNTQYQTIANIVGSKDLSCKYINFQKRRYLSKGHMVAKADFVYGNAQRSTFWYFNAAPQWQSFNGGNWNILEENVRQFAAKFLLTLDVYTGVHGQMKLMDINGNLVPLYLSFNATHKHFPVPQFYWKILYDPVRKLGTAFIGVNDPYASELNDEMFICHDISSKINWLTWTPKNIFKGVSYACAIDDLRQVIPSIPKFEVYDILI